MDALLVTPVKREHPSLAAPAEVVFEGRSRHDTKRAMLKYWSRHRDLDLRDFRASCEWKCDHTAIFHARR